MSLLLKGPRPIILMCLLSFASVSAVLFTPSLPLLAKEFGVNEHVAPLSVTLFLVGYTLGQLPYGPIGNRFGRKRSLSIGLDIALLGTILCIFSTNFWFFCFARFIQALGAAAGLQSSLTMIGDEYAGHRTTKVLSMILLAFAILPGIGTAIGGFITEWYGWKGGFAFLAFYTLALSLSSRLLPETAKSLDRSALDLGRIVHRLGVQFKSRSLLFHGVLLGMSTSVVYIFASEAPFIGISQMGLTAKQFGLWNLFPAFGMVCGLFSATFLAHALPARIGILSGLLTALMGITLLASLFANGYQVPPALFLPMVLTQMGFSLCYSFGSGKALSDSTDKSNASSVLSFLNMGTSTIATFIIGSFAEIAPMALAGIFALALVFQWVLWLMLKPHHR